MKQKLKYKGLKIILPETGVLPDDKQVWKWKGTVVLKLMEAWGAELVLAETGKQLLSGWKLSTYCHFPWKGFPEAEGVFGFFSFPAKMDS